MIDAADDRPVLRALVLDFSTVNNIDVTSIQGLVDTRTQLDHHTYPDRAEWHIANVGNRWTRRALAASGFGFPRVSSSPDAAPAENTFWRPIFSVASSDNLQQQQASSSLHQKDIETGSIDKISSSSQDGTAISRAPGKLTALQAVNRPYFHLDVASAVETAIGNVEGHLVQEKFAQEKLA